MIAIYNQVNILIIGDPTVPLQLQLTTVVTLLQVNTPGPQGPPGIGTSGVILGEVPTGAIDGANQNYTALANFTLIWVWLNGVRMKAGTDYNVSGANTIHFLYPPFVGSILTIDRI